jgi:hypothetical protein
VQLSAPQAHPPKDLPVEQPIELPLTNKNEPLEMAQQIHLLLLFQLANPRENGEDHPR